METQDAGKVNEASPTKRILCIGKITKCRMTMVIAFHKKGEKTMFQFHKAERKKGKLRLAIAGPAGSGNTY